MGDLIAVLVWALIVWTVRRVWVQQRDADARADAESIRAWQDRCEVLR